ncbi:MULTISPECIES: hypothetical protein [Rhizobium]|nr:MULTISPECIES: hypothetical protein [Rhizobium]
MTPIRSAPAIAAERHGLLLVTIEDLQAYLSHKRRDTFTLESSVA